MADYKILVVDDNIDNAENIIDFLADNEKSISFYQALNGQTAFEVAQKKLPDLIITDWEMPIVDGIGLIHLLKGCEATKNIPVIMCTGVMTKNENLKTALDAGAVDYIRKPVEKLELTARVHSMLKLADSIKLIKEQNDELKMQKEEISQQKEEITATLETLKEQSEEIETQHNNLQKSYENVRLMSLIGQEITRHISVEAIIDAVYAEVNKLMPADGFGIGIYNEKENRIEFPGYIEKGKKMPLGWDLLGDDDSFSDWCFKHQKEVWVGDQTQEYHRYIKEPPIVKIGELAVSIIYLPLTANGIRLGNITVQSFQKNAYTQNHLDIFRNIALYAAIALDNASAYQKLDAEKEKVETEKDKSDTLLLNILPKEAAEELKAKGFTSPRHYGSVTVLFTDFKGFTESSARMSPDDLINSLDYCFRKFDRIVQKFGLEKIKTIGDAYMAVSGLPAPNPAHAENALNAALEIREFIEGWKIKQSEHGLTAWEIRIGLHSGPVVAGVVGLHKFAYDVWGDTVNTAARMESSGEPGKVNISKVTHDLLLAQSQARGLLPQNPDWRFEYRGKIEAKGKGEIEMYFVEEGPPIVEQ